MPGEPDKPALLGGMPLHPEGPPDWPVATPQIEQVLVELARSGDWGKYHGPHIPALVEALCEFHRCRFSVLCASGTAAIELALRGVGVGSGDEVVMAAYDFKSNFQNILILGATPVLVDVRGDNLQIDVGRIESAITPRTRALLVSHLHGSLVDMPAVRALANRRGLSLVEDACQMHGAMVAGRIAGTWGDAGVLSFGGSKLLTAGRGGAILSDREDVVQRMKLYTQRGNEAYPLSEMQAAILLPQLDRLPEFNRSRLANVSRLRQALGGWPGFAPLPCDLADSAPSFYKVGFWYDASTFGGLPRERFCAALRAEGFAVDPGFPALHTIHSRHRFVAPKVLSEADRADACVVTLHHPILLDQSDWPGKFARAVEKIVRFADDLRTQ